MSQFKQNNAGRKPGSPNKVTKESREIFLSTLQGQVEHINKAFTELREESAEKYLNTFARYCKFFVPAMTESNEIIEYKHEPFDVKQIFKVLDD